MAKKPTKVKLSLTRDEIELLKDAIIQAELFREEEAKYREEYPDEEILVRIGEKAAEQLPMLSALYIKISKAYSDARYVQ